MENEIPPVNRVDEIRDELSKRPPASSRRKVGTTSSHHAPYVQGCTRATMAGTMGCQAATPSESPKPAPVRIGGCNPPP